MQNGNSKVTKDRLLDHEVKEWVSYDMVLQQGIVIVTVHRVSRLDAGSEVKDGDTN
jgi:hypothetical protein